MIIVELHKKSLEKIRHPSIDFVVGSFPIKKSQPNLSANILGLDSMIKKQK